MKTTTQLRSMVYTLLLLLVTSVLSAQQIGVIGNGQYISDNSGNSPALTNFTDFGGTTSRTFTLDNIQSSGNTTLNVTSIVLSNTTDFTISSDPTPVGITKNDINPTFTIDYIGVSSGTITSTVTVNSSNASNDGSDNAWVFTISITLAPEIDIVDTDGDAIDDGGGNSPSTVNNTAFGSTDLSGSISQTYTIENNGNATLTISSWSSDNTDFSITSTPATSVNSGNTTTFTVTFSPTLIGSASAVITINSNDSDETVYTFNVQGAGTAPPPDFTIYYENFDEDAGGWTASGTGSVWTRGTGLTAVSEFGEGSYWYTNTYNDYVANTLTTLESPIISTTGYQNLEFSVDMRYNLDADNDDGMVVEYRKRTLGIWSSWTVLGSNGEGTYWYDGNGTVDAISAGSDGWTGTTTNTQAIANYFQTAKILAPAILSNSAEIQFRFVFASDSDTTVDDGAVIDNVIIHADPIVAFSDPTLGPGSINSDLKLWLKATEEWDVLSDDTGIASWSDSAFDNDAISTTADRPSWKDNATDNINFNPVVEFDRSNTEFMRGKGGFYAHDYFVVIKSNNTIDYLGTNRQVPLAGRAAPLNPQIDGTGLGLCNISVRFDDEVVAHMSSSVGNDPANESWGKSYSSTSDSYTDEVIIYNVKSNASHTDTEIYKNGKRIDNTVGTTQDGSQNLQFYEFLNQQYYVGVGRFSLNGNVDAYVDGRITEIISYKSDNTALDQQKIQSYLALKNGVTLHATNSTTVDRLNDVDYIDSQGNVIWDTSANSGYNYDIAGIGRDDASEFLQKQSASENKFSDATGPTSGFLSMSLTETYSTNKENIDNNTENFEDREFLIWGNNNADLNAAALSIEVDMSEDIGDPALVTNVSFESMSRIWKVVENRPTGTSDIGLVEVSIPTSVVRTASPPDGRYLMFISQNGIFDPTADYRVMTETGDRLYTKYDFDGTEYITFGWAPERLFSRSVLFEPARSTYIDMEDNFDLDASNSNGTADFTVSAWIKRGAASANTSIISKRDVAYTEGYDIKITSDNKLEMSWMNGSLRQLRSTVDIPIGEWHQVAFIYESGTLSMYIDGVFHISSAMVPPLETTSSFFVGGAAKLNPQSFYDGNIDEVRIWNKALTEAELHYVMNQELDNNATTIGLYFDSKSIVPTKNDGSTLSYADLEGYYPMSRYTYTNTKDESGNLRTGALKQLKTVDYQTAPLPYISTQNGDWDTDATWVNGSEQTKPGAIALADDTKTVDWNIVETSHNITMSNSGLLDDADGNSNFNRSVLAHSIESGTLTIDGNVASSTGYGYTVTHYLNLQGKIDLEGESQLIQTTDSDLVVGTNGELERDQQGTNDIYHYNYWSSPIGTTDTGTNKYSYSIADVMKDRTFDVNFITNSYDGAPGTVGTPVEIADYWIWKFADNTDGDYSEWEHVRSTGTMLAGEGYTMKGSGTIDPTQNYTFLGKPNNGDVELSVSPYNDYLIGNPYASAISARQFILDNGARLFYDDPNTSDPEDTDDGNVPATNGTLYFWEHWGGTNHILSQYQGGYATYNLAGATSAPYSALGVSDPDVSSGGTPTKTPGDYIPVGQGFFIVGNSNGGTIQFNNGQRAFKREIVANGLFVRDGEQTEEQTTVTQDTEDLRRKVKIGFNSVTDLHRQLLLTFDRNTTQGVDWGYDSTTYDYQSDDMFWLIENNFYVIQSNAHRNDSMTYPLAIYTSVDGDNTITIDELINMPDNIDVFLHDIELELFHNLKESDYTIFLNEGYYDTRFEITFKTNPISQDQPDETSEESDDEDTSEEIAETLEPEIDGDELTIVYSNDRKKIILTNPHNINVSQIAMYNMLGQNVQTFKNISASGYAEFNVRNLTAGTYIIRAETASGSVTKKTIVN